MSWCAPQRIAAGRLAEGKLSTLDKTVAKALATLEALSARNAPAGVTSLADETGLTKSNIHRLLSTLEELGYVRRSNEAGQYEPSVKLWRLGSAVHARLNLRAISAPHLSALMRETHESVHLSIFEDSRVIYIDKVESDQPVRAYSQIGDSPPAHAVATGKVLLAAQSDEFLLRLGQGGLSPHTPRTITDESLLLRELVAVRREGYSINRGEWREDVCGVAAPIKDARGEVVASVGISGPANRFKGKFKSLRLPVTECARKISRDLGVVF